MRRVGIPFEVFDNREKLQEKIIETAVRLFVVKGYGNVTVRMICQKSGVSPHQLYGLYADKQALLQAVLDKTDEILQGYFEAVVQEYEQLTSSRQVLDLIYVELHNITNELVYYGLCLAHQLQFVNKQAYRIYNEEFLVGSMRMVQRSLDRVVERGLCAPFNTQAVASLVCCSVIVGNDVRAGQFAGLGPDFDLDQCYSSQADFFLEKVFG